jgi:hypothetical protein
VWVCVCLSVRDSKRVSERESVTKRESEMERKTERERERKRERETECVRISFVGYHRVDIFDFDKACMPAHVYAYAYERERLRFELALSDAKLRFWFQSNSVQALKIR